MSLHNNPKYQTPALVDALKQHGLEHNIPSQLADAFRTGWVAALTAPAQAAALVSPSDDGFMAAVNEMDGLYAAPAQQAAPDMTDAYAGAREDLSIWKKRALEAEALNRKFAASVNSPSFMGEPAAQQGEYPPLPERPEPDGFLTIKIIGRNVEINAYRDSTMKAYAYASIDADRAARGVAQAAPVGMEPVYQIGQPFQGTWRDASKDVYDVCMPSERRIIYTASQTAAVQQDAERYRWLREYAIGAYTSVFRGKSSAAVYLLTRVPALDGIGEETDAAIDAARATQEGKHD